MTVYFFGKYSSRRSPSKEEKIIQCERVRMKIWYFGMRQVSQTVFFEIFELCYAHIIALLRKLYPSFSE